MNRIAPIAIALIVLMVVAVALMSSPDTGDALPAPATRTTTAAPVAALPPSRAPQAEVEGPPPHPIETRRKQNDAMLVGSLGSSWTAIKRELIISYPEQFEALRPEFDAIIQGFRDARRSPDKMDLAALRARQDAMRKHLVAEGLVTPTISAQLLRHDALELEFPVE